VITAVFKTKTRAQWCNVFENSDACFAPILSPHEAAEYSHNKQRGTFLNRDGQLQHTPAPRFARTVPEAGEAFHFQVKNPKTSLTNWDSAAVIFKNW